MSESRHRAKHRQAIEHELRATDPDKSLAVEIEEMLRATLVDSAKKRKEATYRDLMQGARALGALLSYLSGPAGKPESIEEFLKRLAAEERET